MAHEFLNLGFKAIITCVDLHALDRSFAGRIYNKKFLSDLPPRVDPCGENGEFHSFVFRLATPAARERVEVLPCAALLAAEIRKQYAAWG